MNKRLLKKKHAEHIEDVLIEVSQSALWRKALFSTKARSPIRIEGVLLGGLPPWLVRAVRGRRLEYAVFSEPWMPFEDGSPCFRFTVYAEEFPAVRHFSWNSDYVGPE